MMHTEEKSARYTENEQRLFEIQADLMAMFSNPRRIMIMDILHEGEKSVSEIADDLGVTIQNVSQHLRAMKDRGVVVSRKTGQTVYYRPANQKFCDCCRLVRSAIAEELSKHGELLG